MTNLLNIALNCIRRGWYVLPCVPLGKETLGGLVPHGWHDASNDEATIRRWWTAKPDANVGIACNPSKLAVVDCDHGNATKEDALAWMKRAGLPETYTVHTGRRFNPKTGEPEYGVQLYYAGSMAGVGEFCLAGGTGQVKSLDGYVMAASSIHPSGEAYEVLFDLPIAPLPDVVRALKTEHKPIEDDGQPITENRNIRLTSIAGKLRNAGLSATALELALLQVNADRCAPPLEDEEVQRIAANAAKWEMPKPDIPVTIGKPEEPNLPTDPMLFFDSVDSILNAPPVEHVIQGILPKNRYTGMVALSGSRKTIVAWNIVHSCVTGEPFMGRFPVVNAPTRVLFFAAESAPSEVKERLEGMGLIPLCKAGKLIIRSAANETHFHQDLLPDNFVRGTLIIFDTFVRFFDGQDEQNALEARKFTGQMQRLVNAGATVLVLFHAPKGAKGTEMSIESIRGSGELGAGMACAWGLSMLGNTWEDHTRMEQVKKREFQCNPARFDFACDIPTAVCSFVGEATIGTKKPGPKKDAETLAEDAVAEAFVLANITMPHTALSRELMAARGIRRGEKWVRLAKLRLKPGAVHTSG